MSSVVFFFEVHQPRRLYPGHMIDASRIKTPEDLEKNLFNDKLNKEILKRVAEKCYRPMNTLLLEKIDEFKKSRRKFKVSMSVTGTLLEQLERYDRDTLDLFKQLSETKCVEFLGETYYHSLSSFWGIGTERPEFEEQVKMHKRAVKDLLGYNVKFFRNTELLLNSSIAKTVRKLGFRGILGEGVERVLQGRSPEHVYNIKGSDIKVLLRHYRLSDDIAYRFSSRWFEHWPLTADKYAYWLSQMQGEVINLFMDYETFGEHQWESTGIFWFMRALPNYILEHQHMNFMTPSEAIRKYPSRGEIDIGDFETISWADIERDTSAWLGNAMQMLSFEELKRIENTVKTTKNRTLISTWRHLQTSDHLYYQCTKNWSDGDVHKYFSPHGTPHESFEGMIKAITQLEFVSKRYLEEKNKKNGGIGW